MQSQKLLTLAVLILLSGCWGGDPPEPAKPPAQGEQMQQALAEIEQEAQEQREQEAQKRQQQAPAEQQPGETLPPTLPATAPKVLKSRGREDEEQPIDEASGKILAEREETNIPHLAKLLDHANPRVRQEALEVLDNLDPLPPEVQSACAARLNDPNLKVRARALRFYNWSYNETGPHAAALPELVKLLEYADDEELLADALEMVGRYGARAEPAIPALLLQLQRNIYQLEYKSLDALGEIGVRTPQAVPLIVQQLDDHAEEACYALGRMGYAQPLLAFWKDQENNYRIRYAVRGLGHINPTTPEILQAIRAGLQSEEEGINTEAARALGLVRPSSPEVLEMLKLALASESEETRAAAAASLGTLDPQPEGVIDLLLKAAGDKEKQVQDAATTALGKLKGSPEARFSTLALALLRSNEYEIRNALEENEEEALPVLQAIAADKQKNAELRTAAVMAIAIMHDDESGDILKLLQERLEDATEPISLRAMAACELQADGEGHPDCFATMLAGLKDSPYPTVRNFCTSVGEFDFEAHPEQKPQAVAALIAALQDQEGETARSAAEGLAELADPAAFEPLKRLALDPKAPYWLSGLSALRQLDGKLGEAVPVYLHMLKTDEDIWKRDAAAEQIAYIFSSDERTPGDIPDLPALVAGLTAGLRDEEEMVRAECAQTLGLLGAEAAPAIEGLTALVQDREVDAVYRMRAVWTLGQIGDPARKTLPAIIACLNEESVQEHIYSRRDGLAVLMNLKASDEQLLPMLRQAFSRPLDAWDMAGVVKFCIPLGSRAAPLKDRLVELLEHEGESVRQAAAEALGGLGEAGKTAVPKLASHATSDPDGDVRQASLQALITLQPDHPQVLEAMVSGLRSDDTRYEFRRMILARPTQALPALLKGLDDESITLRREIFSILSELPDQKALTPIYVKGIEDENPELRQYAALALAKVGGYPAQVIPVIIAALQQEELEDRYEYSNYLQQIRGMATAPVVAALVDPQTSLQGRLQLQEALGYEPVLLQAEREKLEAATRSEQLPVKAAAVLALLRGEQEPEEKWLAPLLELIQSDDEEIRNRAIQLLTRFPRQRQQIIPLLLQRLKQDEEGYSVGYVLGELMDADHLPDLLKLLDGPEFRPRALQALQRMEDLPESVMPRLLELLKASDDEDEREMLINALSNIGPAVLPEFQKLLQDQQAKPDLQVACLQRIHARFDEHPEARKLAEPLLKDENIQVAVTAAITLAGLTPEEETPPVELLPLLLKGATDPEHEYYLAGAYLRFRQQGSSVYPELQKMLDSKNPQHRREALLAIAPLRADAPELLNRIAERLQSGDEEVDASDYAEALVEIGPYAIPALVPILNLEKLDAEVKQGILRLLGHKIAYVDDEESALAPYQPLLAPLEKILAAENLILAAEAGGVLHKLAPEASREKILAVARKALESTDVEVQTAGLSLALELREAAEPLLPLILTKLENPELHDNVFSVLSYLDEKAAPAVPEVVKYCETKSVSYQALEFLGSQGEQAKPAVPLLKQLLQNERWMNHALYTLRNSEVVSAEELFQMVQPLLEQPLYRVVVLDMLKEFQPLPEATRLFTGLLEDPDPALRLIAVRYLSRVADEDAGLSQKLLDLTQSDPSFTFRRTLLGSLRYPGLKLPPETQVPALLKILTGPEPQLYGPTAYLLGKNGEQAAPAVPRLVELLDPSSTDNMQTALLQTLGEIGPAAEPAVPKLREILKQKNRGDLQWSALYLAESLGDKALPALPEIIALATSPGEDLADRAALLAWKLDPAAAKAAGLPEPKEE